MRANQRRSRLPCARDPHTTAAGTRVIDTLNPQSIRVFVQKGLFESGRLFAPPRVVGLGVKICYRQRSPIEGYW